MRRLLVFIALFVISCGGSPTEPRTLRIADGRWTGDGACLTVRSGENNLVVGCGHGVFPAPEIRNDGTFDVDGTYRIEAGPISIDPPPPAHYSGSVTATTVTLTVRPASGPAATYRLRMNANGQCGPACV